MAKKNKSYLLGYVHEFLSEDTFTIQIRKNEKRFVYPIVKLTEDQKHLKTLLTPGVLISVEGKITTEKRDERYECPMEGCNGVIVDNYVFTYVKADKIHIMNEVTEDPFMNNVILLGVVCNEKDFKYIQGTKSPIANTRYQVAVNRKGPNETDYPWIASFARQAEEDARRLDKGSQILIDGIINTRRNTKVCSCEKCESSIEVSEPLMEVVASSVEYLNNCMFTEE